MRVPNIVRAKVPRRKITDYLLSTTHRTGRAKAAFFMRFGFRSDHWRVLAQALREHGKRHETVKVEPTPFGTRYTVDGALDAPDGRRPRVRTVWFIERGETVPHLTTAYPRGGRLES